MPLNWILEWGKWTEILKFIDEENNSNNKTAFASGIISSFLTPSLSGNFLGRIFYYDKSKRWKITTYSMIGNFAQFLISVVFGIVALYFTPNLFQIEKWILTTLTIVAIIITLTYFRGEKILQNIQITKLQSLLLQIKKGPSRLKMLNLSFLRYLVFIAQYSLALNAFGEPVDLMLICLISIIFLLITLTPSMFFGKILIRESIAVSVLSYVGIGPVLAIFASFTTWVTNLFIPAFVALIYVKKKK